MNESESEQGAAGLRFWIPLAAIVLALVGLVALLLTTLGVGPYSDQAKIEKAVEGYRWAYAEGDGETACSLLANPGRDCVRNLSGLGPYSPTNEFLSDLRSIEVERVRISGDDGYAYLETGEEVVLKKVDGDWLIQQ